MIHARTIDNAGNTSNDKTADSWKDSTPPPKVDLSFNAKTENSVTVNTSGGGTDTTSGIAKYVFEYKISTASDWTTAIEQTSLPNSYKYTGLTAGTTYNFRVKTVDNAGNENSTGTDVTQEIIVYVFTDNDVGKVVNYAPKAGQWYSTTVNGTEYSGTGNQAFSTDDLSGEWKLFDVDTTYIYIIASKPTSKTLGLRGALGYNNGVTLLNNICDSCFTDKTQYPSSTGRSIKLEDIQRCLLPSATNRETNYGTAPYTYEPIVWPYVWKTYETSKNIALTENSKSYTLTANSWTSSGTRGTPYCNAVSYSNNYDDYWKTINLYQIFDSMSSEGKIWLATRCCTPNSNTSVNFYLQSMSYGRDVGLAQLTSNSKDANGWSYYDFLQEMKILPIVSFPRSRYSLSEAGGTFDIVSK